jgi:hypothetical protein
LAAGATLAVLNVKGGFTVINWPTAFVIAVAMICGAFLFNKPSDAAFGGDGGDGLTAIECDTGFATTCFIHAHKGQLRNCMMRGNVTDETWLKTHCTDWLTVTKFFE